MSTLFIEYSLSILAVNSALYCENSCVYDIMDLIEKFLREVPKDSEGFEDLEAFWNDAGKVIQLFFSSSNYRTFIEKINFPLPKRVKTKLIDSVNLDINRLRFSQQQSRSARHATTLPSDDSDTDFDYDTASSISSKETTFFSDP